MMGELKSQETSRQNNTPKIPTEQDNLTIFVPGQIEDFAYSHLIRHGCRITFLEGVTRITFPEGTVREQRLGLAFVVTEDRFIWKLPDGATVYETQPRFLPDGQTLLFLPRAEVEHNG